MISFILNSLRIDRAPDIIRHALQHEQWIVLMFVTLMGVTLLFGLWVKKLGSELAGPKQKRKSKRRKTRRPAD